MYMCVKTRRGELLPSLKPAPGCPTQILLSVDSDSANNEHITMIILANIKNR